jgi:hypothetical protein
VAVVMIGIDPHKGSHTAVALAVDETRLGQIRVRASAAQVENLRAWAASSPERIWAIEGATGLGRRLAQQLLAAGEQVLDVQPKLAARVRLLNTATVNNNDPNDARSVAVAATRSPEIRAVATEDHASVMKVWLRRHRDLSRATPGQRFRGLQRRTRSRVLITVNHLRFGHARQGRPRGHIRQPGGSDRILVFYGIDLATRRRKYLSESAGTKSRRKRFWSWTV